MIPQQLTHPPETPPGGTWVINVFVAAFEAGEGEGTIPLRACAPSYEEASKKITQHLDLLLGEGCYDSGTIMTQHIYYLDPTRREVWRWDNEWVQDQRHEETS